MSNKPTRLTYDQLSVGAAYLPQQHILYDNLAGTLLGTVATGADLVDLFKLPANSGIQVTGVSARIIVGGTAAAAGSAWGIGKSLAGTGTTVNFGTLVMGTRADATYGNFSVTSTTLAAADVLRLTSIAGTAASNPGSTMDKICVEYLEDWS